MRMPAAATLLLALLTLGLSAGASPPSSAPPEVVLWGGDSPYLMALAGWYKIDPVVIVTIGQGTKDPLDTHVNLFLAKAANGHPMTMYSKRMSGTTWQQMLDEYEIDPALLFTPLEVAPPAEYARLYREREKREKDPAYRMVVYDKDVRYLVGLRFCVEALEMAPGEVFDGIAGGMSLQEIILDRLGIAPRK